jgi:hypothetical protein
MPASQDWLFISENLPDFEEFVIEIHFSWDKSIRMNLLMTDGSRLILSRISLT